MNITKEQIDKIIEDFKKEKDSIKIKDENLKKFDLSNKEDKEFYSYIEGQGGYYLKFLKYLIEKTRPNNIAELGNREGLSTLCIFDAIQNTNLNFYTIDIEKDQRYCPDEMFKDKSVFFLFGDACSINIIKKIPFDINFLFSDTIHYNYQITDEFNIYQYLLSDTALVAVDDIKTNDKELFFENIKYSKWDLTELCHVSGWGLFLFERKEKLSQEERYKKILEMIANIWERKYREQLSINNKLEDNKPSNKIKKILKKNKFIYKISIFINKLK